MRSLCDHDELSFRRRVANILAPECKPLRSYSFESISHWGAALLAFFPEVHFSTVGAIGFRNQTLHHHPPTLKADKSPSNRGAHFS